MPLSLTYVRHMVRHHEEPIELTGTVTAEQLKRGARYVIYRWDSVDAAFTHEPAHEINGCARVDVCIKIRCRQETFFTAAGDTCVYEGPKTFLDNCTTYYRCVGLSALLVEGAAA